MKENVTNKFKEDKQLVQSFRVWNLCTRRIGFGVGGHRRVVMLDIKIPVQIYMVGFCSVKGRVFWGPIIEAARRPKTNTPKTAPPPRKCPFRKILSESPDPLI